MVVVSSSLVAGAGDLSFRAEGSGAFPLGAPQSQYFYPGFDAQLTALYALQPWLSVELAGNFFRLPPTGYAGVLEGTSGLGVGAGARLQWPAEGRLVRPWAELTLDYQRTGALDRFGLAPGVGVNFRLAPTHAFWFGPQVRWLHVFPGGQLSNQVKADANLLFLGLGVEFDVHLGAAAAPVPVVVAPPPPNPDPDGDGVVGAADQCPTVAGPASLHGCPDQDRDGDGLMDSVDQCPQVAGVASSNGCPDPDADGDGVPDRLDQCPQVQGLAVDQGCPKVEPRQVRVAEKELELTQKVLFATGKDAIEKSSYPLLDEVAQVLTLRTAVCVNIEGHTDSLGDPKKNLQLSQERATAVKTYLVAHGVEARRLSALGLGDTRPLAPNAKAEGRELNRRVVFSIVPCTPVGAK